jgi:hypothetical protein
MNCPECHYGMLETLGYVEVKAGPLEFKMTHNVPDEVPANLRAAPESLSLAKRTVRDIVHAHRKLP